MEKVYQGAQEMSISVLVMSVGLRRKLPFGVRNPDARRGSDRPILDSTNCNWLSHTTYHRHVKMTISSFPPHRCAWQRARAFSLFFISSLVPHHLNFPPPILAHERLQTVRNRQDRYFPLSEPQLREWPHRNCCFNNPHRKQYRGRPRTWQQRCCRPCLGKHLSFRFFIRDQSVCKRC